jgi:hypothetical protein
LQNQNFAKQAQSQKFGMEVLEEAAMSTLWLHLPGKNKEIDEVQLVQNTLMFEQNQPASASTMHYATLQFSGLQILCLSKPHWSIKPHARTDHELT